MWEGGFVIMRVCGRVVQCVCVCAFMMACVCEGKRGNVCICVIVCDMCDV